MPFFRRLLSLLVAAVLASCASSDTYYMLSADPAPNTMTSSGPNITVGPIRLPAYIDRPELVFESTANRFEIPSSHRWASPLSQGFAQTLVADLSGQLKNPFIHAYPSTQDKFADFRVTVDISQFHAQSGGDSLLRAHWRIVRFTASGEEPVKSGRVDFTEPVIGDGYEAVVAAESRLVSRLAAEIADAF